MPIARPHSWPGRFAAPLAKSRRVEREAARCQRAIADGATARRRDGATGAG